MATSSGRVYPKDKDDWCILLPEIPGHLKKLKSQGYKLVMFSNQAGIGTQKVKIPDFQSKVKYTAIKHNTLKKWRGIIILFSLG